VPFTDEETVEATTGLGDAYGMANDALENDLGVDYWRKRVKNIITITSDSEDSEDMDVSPYEEGDSDLELEKAIRASREHYYGKLSSKQPIKLLTPSRSPPVRVQKRQVSPTTSNKTQTKIPFGPSTNFSSTFSNSPQDHKRFRTPSASLGNRFSFADQSATVGVEKEDNGTRTGYTTQSIPLQPRSLFDCIRNGSAVSAPTSDVIDGEM
jgi:hypothetical protein